MPSDSLPHYLRTFRRRCGLTQRELAWLLGCESRSKVSHYERFVRKPSLESLLALEFVFEAPASELFGGIFETVAAVVKRRAKVLLRRVEGSASGKHAEVKARMLRRLCTVEENGALRRDA